MEDDKFDMQNEKDIVEWNHHHYENLLSKFPVPNQKNFPCIAFFKKKDRTLLLYQSKISNRKNAKFIFPSVSALKTSISLHFHSSLFYKDEEKLRREFIDKNFIIVKFSEIHKLIGDIYEC